MKNETTQIGKVILNLFSAMIFIGAIIYIYKQCATPSDDLPGPDINSAITDNIDSTYQKNVDMANENATENIDKYRHLDNDYRPATDADVVFNSSWDGSVSQVEDYLKNTLNDADSYESVEWYDANRYFSRSYAYGVRHTYRAKNAFGALILKDQLFYLDGDGNVIDVKDWDSLK
jgi:hypothetical protein